MYSEHLHKDSWSGLWPSAASRGIASDRIQKEQRVSEYIEWKIWKNVDPNDPNGWNS